MEKMIAYCGIVCSECGAFIATKNNDNVKRKQVAEEWSKIYSQAIKPEDINCVGCMSTKGTKLAYCTICEIRKCSRAKKVKNCIYCADYVCEKLAGFFPKAQIKANLDEIRERIKQGA